MAMKCPDGFYVYAYLRAQDSAEGEWLAQTPYYIGKGCGERAWVSHGFLHRPKSKANIVILADALTEKEAFQFEIELTKIFGRIDKGTGCLRNKTDGGDGASGVRQSDETRAKKRAAMAGEKNPHYGKRLSPEACLKMSIARKGQQPWNTGKRWSPEVLKKFSDAKLGRPSPLKGKKLSPEHVKKLSISHMGQAFNIGKKRVGASSPYYGVSWSKAMQRWISCVRVEGKLRYLGVTTNEMAAARIYDDYIIKNGLDRPLNFPESRTPIGQLSLVWG